MHGFRIGRIFGIDLRVDWSWTFIFVLLTWNLVDVFSRWHPDWSPIEAFAVATAATFAFFGCVLLHELAHSIVAVRFGMRVRSITLFLFGGGVEYRARTPVRESRISHGHRRADHEHRTRCHFHGHHGRGGSWASD